MAKEIERKFLVYENGVTKATPAFFELDPSYKSMTDVRKDVALHGINIKQGYLPIDIGYTIAKELGRQVDFEPTEARLRNANGVYFFTMKSDGDVERDELPDEEPILKELFDRHWPATEGRREGKYRLKKLFLAESNNTGRLLEAEIDLYKGRDLILVEVEVPSLEAAAQLTPLGRDVTDDPAYKNVNLAQ